MSIQLNMTFKKIQNGYIPSFFVDKVWNKPEEILTVDKPVTLELWDPTNPTSRAKEFISGYEQIEVTKNGTCGTCKIASGNDGDYVIEDMWHQVSADTWQVDRKIKIVKAFSAVGIRQRLDFTTSFAEGTEYTGLHYFVPPVLYDHNDLDEDGIEDYLETQNLTYREDRLNIPAVMAYHEKRKISMTLIRADLPQFDSLSGRKNKERVFLQETDIGSLGFWKMDREIPQMCLRAYYPFYEGERSHALINEERPAWEAFWPVRTDVVLEMSYQIRIEEAPNFI